MCPKEAQSCEAYVEATGGFYGPYLEPDSGGAAAALPSATTAPEPDANGASGGLTAEVFANSVMRGTPICKRTVPNGFSLQPEALCPSWNGIFTPGEYSIRLTGTLSASGAARWHRFTTTVGPSAMVRLWVDDHRLVDAWEPRGGGSGGGDHGVAAGAPPAGYALWSESNIPDNHNEFPTGKIDSPTSLEDCAKRCDELKSAGCIGFVAAERHATNGIPATCYMRRLPSHAAGCSAAIQPAAAYAVYTRNSSCTFPAGWTPAGKHGSSPDSPSTPALLPNVTMGSERPVFVRVDLRPMEREDPVTFSLGWTTDPTADTVPVPSSALSPTVSDAQAKRRKLQEAAGTGWSHWARRSQLAQIALPQQVGVQLGIRNASGAVFENALPQPLGHDKLLPQAAQVQMGAHAYDGSFSSISLIPFPEATERSNVTVETAHVKPTHGRAPSPDGDIGDCVIVATSDSSAELSLVVTAQAFWGAAASISAGADGSTITMRSGDLGTVTVSVSGGALSAVASDGSEPPTQIEAKFGAAGEPLVISLSFSGKKYTAQEAKAAIAAQRAATQAALAAGGRSAGGLTEAYEAMATVIAWNVNFDPRVAVTCPVSRTFEANFDFIFFDWDMYFLSLMAGTRPAADDAGAWGVAISNLIEVTQTRSAYGQVMNKRAAVGSKSSDTNDRSEPYVGSRVVLRIYQDACRSSNTRCDTMKWVVELLFPSLLGWNQWAWNGRRYNVGKDAPHGGLIVLGADFYTRPCEGGTVTSPNSCSGGGGGGGSAKGAAILESGMDNSPMYYNSFDDQPAGYDTATGRLELYDVQQSALFVSESTALQELAAVAGAHAAAAIPMLKEQSAAMSKLVNQSLWDESTGIYRQRDASNMSRGFSPVLS